jgi:nucleoside-diphosphate-sugar epimerase
MLKILITGGAGYIGSKLTTKLVNIGYDVTVIDKLQYNKNSLSHLYIRKNFKLITGDVTDKKLIKKEITNKDIIIPLAALVGAPLCEKNKILAKKVNQDAIKIIINYKKNEQKIIFLTTNSGYGVGDKKKLCDEQSPLKPISLYGITKNNAEKIICKSKNYICFRLATVFGYSFRMRTDLLVNNFIFNAIKKKKLFLFEENFRRNFIHIDDVIDAIIFSIINFKKLKNNIFNLGLSSANITKQELAKKIKKEIKDLKILKSKNKKDPDKRDYFVSNKKIEKAGFKAKISLENGIKELVQVFQTENQSYKNNY